MRTSAFMAGEAFAQLRRQIERIEANAPPKTRENSRDSTEPTQKTNQKKQGEAAEPSHVAHARAPPLAPRRASATLPFAIPKLDALLAGGLRRAALHELRVGESRDAAAMTGFAAALLTKLGEKDTRPILWILEKQATDETGFPSGNGLAAFGLDPAHLFVVRVTKPADALWVFEEGLRCRGLAAVVTEMRGNPRLLDLTASRRLALRAREHGVLGLLLRQTSRAEPGAANTRWLVTPRPAGTDDDFPEGIGNPAWRLTLERNRQGATGTFDVEWNHDRRIFALASPAHPRTLPPVPVDRPPPPPEQGQIVALRPKPKDAPLPREERRRHLRSRG